MNEKAIIKIDSCNKLKKLKVCDFKKNTLAMPFHNSDYQGYRKVLEIGWGILKYYFI